MQSEQGKKLAKLRARVQGDNPEATIESEFYLLAKELGCLPDLIGREYEIEYDGQGRINKVRQLPMPLPSFISLMNEMEKDIKRQEKQMKASKRKSRK